MVDNRLSVLIVDAGPRHTIDIVRSLGRRGIDVTILSSERHPPARFSRYVSKAIYAPLPSDAHDVALGSIEACLATGRYDAAIASGLTGFRVLSREFDRLKRYARIPIAGWEQFEIAEDKRDITHYAENHGIRVPQTYSPNGIQDLEQFRDIQYPVVVKARRGQGHYAYADSYKDLKNVIYPQICARVPDQVSQGIYPILQEYISGQGHGFYALMNHGRVRAFFMHERLHEVPPSGGPSALAASYYDEALIEAGSNLLSALNWHGVAMVEFKKDNVDGQYKLIEINPKFWGSLGLSIAYGIDFPYLLIKMALANEVELVAPSADKRLMYQWLSMDMAHSWAAGNPFLWLDSIRHGVPNDFQLSDPLPNLALIGQGGLSVLRGTRKINKPGG